MSSAPTVSILTTCYNREKFLGECIESVQRSHFQDYEHIIVDDCSTDGSVEVARSFAKDDGRIKVYVNSENLGDYPNRNAAASHAQGEFIKYLDADDMHGRFKLDILVDALEQFPSAAFALTDTGQNKPAFPKLFEPEELFVAHYSGKHGVFGRSPLNAIIRLKAFNEVGGFSGKQYVGDFELWHKLGVRFPCVITCGVPGLWRFHSNQQSADNRKDVKIPFKYLLISRQYMLDPKTPIKTEDRAVFLKNINRRISRNILTQVKTGNFRTMHELKNISELSWRDVVNYAT